MIKSMATYALEQGIFVEFLERQILHRMGLESAREKLVTYLKSHGSVRASEFRSYMGISRSHATALLDYFCDLGVTNRESGPHRLAEENSDDGEHERSSAELAVAYSARLRAWRFRRIWKLRQNHSGECMGCWCASRTSNPMAGPKQVRGGFDSHTAPPRLDFLTSSCFFLIDPLNTPDSP